MTRSLVLTLIGRDRPGLVNALAGAVAEAGGNWLESRLAHLAGQFAGIVRVALPEANIPGLTAALGALGESGLRIGIEPAAPAGAGQRVTIWQLDLVGHDRPGIVRDATSALLSFGISIEEFSSGIESAPFTGGEMFRLTARLAVPENVALEDLREGLERLAGEIMVDLSLKEVCGKA
ncbi:MAG: glycine cleavage system protein R [Acetobacteraceae bacterium]